jgi:hypothetical protein
MTEFPGEENLSTGVLFLLFLWYDFSMMVCTVGSLLMETDG